MKKKENEEAKVNRRKFIKNASIIGGAVAAAPLLNIASQEKVQVDKRKMMMSKVLTAKAAMTHERKLVENTIGNVTVNAFMGHKRGSGVDFVAAYKKLGGKNKESLAIFSNLNKKLAAKAIFSRGMNDKVIQLAINESIAEFAAGNIGVVSAKNRVNRYDIVSSSFRVMVDLGGRNLRTLLDRKKVGIKGYNR